LCANLPYIPTSTLHNLPIYGREPTLALNGGSDGLDLVRKLLHLALEWLAPHALMLLEIEATRGMQALNLAHDFFHQAKIHLHQQTSPTLTRMARRMPVTSANISGQPSPSTTEEVFAQLAGRIDLIVDGGKTPGGVPSTVVDCTSSQIKILREGPITLDDIKIKLSSAA